MNRIVTFTRKSFTPYQWYREKYHKIANVVSILAIVLMVSFGIICVTCSSNPNRIVSIAISSMLWGFSVSSIVATFIFRYVDEYEKKMSSEIK